MGEHIPKFKTRDEEARFWQETSLEQLSPDAVTEVSVSRPDQPRSTTFAIRLDPRTIELVRRIAQAQDVGPTQLVRSWILERLQIEKAVGAAAGPAEGFSSEFELLVRERVVSELMKRIPAAAEDAIQEVLDRADQEISDLRGSS